MEGVSTDKSSCMSLGYSLRQVSLYLGIKVHCCVLQHAPQKLLYSSFGRFTVCSKLFCHVGVCLIFLAFFMTLFFIFTYCEMVGALELEKCVLAGQLQGLAELGRLLLAVFLLHNIYCIFLKRFVNNLCNFWSEISLLQASVK